MAKIEIEVTDQEKEWITSYAELQGLNISEAIVGVVMDKLREGVVISDEKDKDKDVRGRSLDELFEGFDGVYTTEEIDWGEPVGEEVW